MSEVSPSATSLSGRTAVVTGAGAGLGRAEALALAASGARVVVNDLGPGADAVAAEIRALGGDALSALGDIGDWAVGEELVSAAVDTFGSLDVVVNNAGITRDAMLFNLSESDWDDVIRVHLKGHAGLSRAAAVHWRRVSKETGAPTYGRVVNTSSEAFLFGGPGQANYAAAKAGITALTVSTARGLRRYGVTANAICPRARTQMTADVLTEVREAGGLDLLAPERAAAFVAYLAAPAAAHITGQVFVVYSDFVALLAPPVVEHTWVAENGTFAVTDFADSVGAYFAERPAEQTFSATHVAALDNTGTAGQAGPQ
jgi:3-oxoacyl-[acyl-carrier protein] reductase